MASVSGLAGAGKSTSGLELQLNQYKSKLSDQETCPSGKTAQGRANIARLQEKVSEIKNNIAAVDNGTTATPATPATSGSFPPSAARPGELGGRVDVYA